MSYILDKTGKNEIHYQLQFLICSCAASRLKQQQVSQKHRSSLQIEKDKEAKRRKMRKESHEERTIRLEKKRAYKYAKMSDENVTERSARLKRNAIL